MSRLDISVLTPDGYYESIDFTKCFVRYDTIEEARASCANNPIFVRDINGNFIDQPPQVLTKIAIRGCASIIWSIYVQNEESVASVLAEEPIFASTKNGAKSWFLEYDFMISVYRDENKQSDSPMTGFMISFGNTRILDLFIQSGHFNFDCYVFSQILVMINEERASERYNCLSDNMENVLMHIIANYKERLPKSMLTIDNIAYCYKIENMFLAHEFVELYLDIESDALRLIEVADKYGDIDTVIKVVDSIGDRYGYLKYRYCFKLSMLMQKRLSGQLIAYYADDYRRFYYQIEANYRLFLTKCSREGFMHLLKIGFAPKVPINMIKKAFSHPRKINPDYSSWLLLCQYTHLMNLSKSFSGGYEFYSWIPNKLQAYVDAIYGEYENPNSHISKLPEGCVAVIIGKLLASYAISEEFEGEYTLDRCIWLAEKNFD